MSKSNWNLVGNGDLLTWDTLETPGYELATSSVFVTHKYRWYLLVFKAEKDGSLPSLHAGAYTSWIRPGVWRVCNLLLGPCEHTLNCPPCCDSKVSACSDIQIYLTIPAKLKQALLLSAPWGEALAQRRTEGCWMVAPSCRDSCKCSGQQPLLPHPDLLWEQSGASASGRGVVHLTEGSGTVVVSTAHAWDVQLEGTLSLSQVFGECCHSQGESPASCSSSSLRASPPPY